MPETRCPTGEPYGLLERDANPRRTLLGGGWHPGSADSPRSHNDLAQEPWNLCCESQKGPPRPSTLSSGSVGDTDPQGWHVRLSLVPGPDSRPQVNTPLSHISKLCVRISTFTPSKFRFKLSSPYPAVQLEAAVQGLGSPFSCPLTSSTLIPNDIFSRCFRWRAPVWQGCAMCGPEEPQAACET